MAPRLKLFPFRYRDPRTGKWVRARYLAELHEIKARHAEFEIIGPAELRDVDPDARYFSPNFNAMMNAEMRRFRERPPEIVPAIDGLEAYLVRTFLRRYVTYCARRGRFAAMNGAARLYADVSGLVAQKHGTRPRDRSGDVLSRRALSPKSNASGSKFIDF